MIRLISFQRKRISFRHPVLDTDSKANLNKPRFHLNDCQIFHGIKPTFNCQVLHSHCKNGQLPVIAPGCQKAKLLDTRFQLCLRMAQLERSASYLADEGVNPLFGKNMNESFSQLYETYRTLLLHIKGVGW